MRTLPGLIAIAMLGALAVPPPLAQAQVIYRSTMKDGKKVISERPMPGAVKVEELKVSPGNYAPGAQPNESGAPGTGPRTAGGSGPSALAAADRDLRNAQKDYDAALDRAAKGKEEKEGDRQGTAGGGARLTDAYNQRQASLQAEVDAAKARLDAARKKFNDAR